MTWPWSKTRWGSQGRASSERGLGSSDGLHLTCGNPAAGTMGNTTVATVEKGWRVACSGAQYQGRALELAEQTVFHEDDVAAQRQDLVDDHVHHVVDVIQKRRALRGDHLVAVFD